MDEHLIFNYGTQQVHDCINFNLHFLNEKLGKTANEHINKVKEFSEKYPKIYKRFIDGS